MENKNLDALDIIRRDDGYFEIKWDPNDSNWSWLNDLTSEEIGNMIDEAFVDYLKENYNDALE